MNTGAEQVCATPDPHVERIFAEFNAATVDPAEFNHEAHVLVAWRFLQDDELLSAIAKYSAALKTLTSKLGVASKYHETITWFYMIAVGERLSTSENVSWHSFKAANEDLLARDPSLIGQFYSGALLMSENARRVFVLPDKAPQ